MLSGRWNHGEKRIALPFPLSQVIRPKLKISRCQFRSDFQYLLPDGVMSHFPREPADCEGGDNVRGLMKRSEFRGIISFRGLVIGQYVFCTLKMHFHFLYSDSKEEAAGSSEQHQITPPYMCSHQRSYCSFFADASSYSIRRIWEKGGKRDWTASQRIWQQARSLTFPAGQAQVRLAGCIFPFCC